MFIILLYCKAKYSAKNDITLFFFSQSLTQSWNPVHSLKHPRPQRSPPHLFGPPDLPSHGTGEPPILSPKVAAARGPVRVSGEQVRHKTISERDI